MIDGLKAKVLHQKGDVWRGCDVLDFAVSVSARTGEVFTNRPQLAEYNGLTFKIVPPVNAETHKETCYLVGSLHKFKNKGLHNADDFTLTDIKNAVEDLQRLHIGPENTLLENLEFGVNILLPYDCRTVLNSVVSMSSRQFVELKFQGVPNGKRLTRSRYELKIYDKGKTETGKESHLLRVELRVKEMSILNKTIVTLGDLTDKKRISSLGRNLVGYLKKVVMYDYSPVYVEKYPLDIQLKISNWSNPNYWPRLTPMQRMREQKAFGDFKQSTGANKMQADLIKAVADKWDELLNVTPSVSAATETVSCANVATLQTETASKVGTNVTKTVSFETVSTETVSDKRNGLGYVCAIKINDTFITNQQTKEQKKEIFRGGARNFENLKICDCCGADISDKRPQTIFCSVKCKNRFNNARRPKVNPSVSATVTASDIAPSVSATVETSETSARPIGKRSAMLRAKLGTVKQSATVTASDIAPSVSDAVTVAPWQKENFDIFMYYGTMETG